MGLQGSPASSARLVDYCMRGLQGVLTYIDDVLCHARSHEEHLQVVEKVFLRLRKYGCAVPIHGHIDATCTEHLWVRYISHATSLMRTHCT